MTHTFSNQTLIHTNIRVAHIKTQTVSWYKICSYTYIPRLLAILFYIGSRLHKRIYTAQPVHTFMSLFISVVCSVERRVKLLKKKSDLPSILCCTSEAKLNDALPCLWKLSIWLCTLNRLKKFTDNKRARALPCSQCTSLHSNVLYCKVSWGKPSVRRGLRSELYAGSTDTIR